MKIRIGQPLKVVMIPYLLRHFRWFDGTKYSPDWELYMTFEVLNFTMLHEEFIKNVLVDSEGSLHTEKLKDLEFAIKLMRDD